MDLIHLKICIHQALKLFKENTKEDMIFAMDHTLNESIAFEAKKQIDAFKSHDLKEGVSAFIEKRKPDFLGK